MVTEAEAFCLSCGVARNRGSNCEYCGRLYVDVSKADSKPAPHRSLAPKYKVKKSNNKTVISWSWKKRSTWILIPIALFWIGLALTMDGEKLLTDPLSTFPVPLIPVLIGLWLLCFAIVKLSNKTAIQASRQSLNIRHYPLPWRRNIRYKRSEIKQLSVSTVQRRDEHRSWTAPVLELVTSEGIRHALLSGYNEAQFSDFETLCHELKNALGLEQGNM